MRILFQNSLKFCGGNKPGRESCEVNSRASTDLSGARISFQVPCVKWQMFSLFERCIAAQSLTEYKT